ncbi:RNase P/RNase MRP complex subunit [Physocladia obscura]|uniref:RNase P/RNase MRP complex subunit n=1 Tax=Physocladia obscura TaxID=109957 RepID=A0AAD5SUS9_9FUNG|nr:RNase P/RNase MRP complex subunit [Physocladia obscura]
MNLRAQPKGDFYGPLGPHMGIDAIGAGEDSGGGFAVHELFMSEGNDGVNNTVTTAKQARAVFAARLLGKVTALDNQPKDAARKKVEKEARRKKKVEKRPAHAKKALSRADRRRLGDTGPLAASSLSYKALVPLHRLWMQYMADLFADQQQTSEQTTQLLVNKQSSQITTHYSSDAALSKIAKADFHGAVFTVVHSKCKQYVGISGIMIKESDGMFYIMTRENKIKAIPKSHSNFAFVHDGQLFTLYGAHLKGSAADRVNKKIRAKNSIEII